MTGPRIRASCWAAIALLSARDVAAQTYSVTSVTTADLGTIAAAASGATVFTIDPATGAVTKQSGTGARVSGTSTRSLITISCSTPGNCDKDLPKLTITPAGAATNRANTLTNFTLSVVGATATIDTPPGSGNSITATLGPIGKGLSKTIYVGMDATYSGDNSVAATGRSDASFAVTVTRGNGSNPASLTGLVTATVLRTLTITTGTALAFGRISRPRAGSGVVSLSPGASSVAVTGDGVAAITGGPASSATLSASGEGGQVVTITVPASFTMVNGASSLIVTTNAINAGAQTLSGTMGGAGTKVVTIGGTFPVTASTQLGPYSGSITVTFQYN